MFLYHVLCSFNPQFCTKEKPYFEKKNPVAKFLTNNANKFNVVYISNI